MILLVPKALRLFPRLPDEETTRRLYRQATGFDHDRANADMAVVRDRLTFLNLAPERLVCEVATWLVTWVADGRPGHGPDHDLLENQFAELVELKPKDETFLSRLDGYQNSWSDFLGTT